MGSIWTQVSYQSRQSAVHGATASILLFLGLTLNTAAGDENSNLPAALKASAPNTWVKVHNFSESGARSAAAFFYDPHLRKFELTGGAPGGSWGQSPRHFDNEEFDLATAIWTNAYPAQAGDDYAPPSGTTHAPQTMRDDAAHDFRRDKAGYLRIPWWRSYGSGSGVNFQYAYATDSRKLLAYVQNQTMTYDPAARSWSQTGAAPFSKGAFMHWGSFCYDPVHQEVISVGGSSDEPGGTPGTWVYKFANNRWEQLRLGSDGLNQLRGKVADVRRAANALIGACRNRFHLTENQVEANAPLDGSAGAIAVTVDSLCSLPIPPNAPPGELAQRLRASPLLKKAALELTTLKETLSRPISAATIMLAQSVCDDLDRAVNALAVEPPARGLSQMAYDAQSRKIVLFGGDGLDRHYADTWVYDCVTRTWEQRYPTISPSPRAGHALVYLPRGGKVLLAGGYRLGNGHSYMYGDVYGALPFEVWIYDTTANAWSLLPTSGAPPTGSSPTPIPMAADENDNLLYLVPSGRFGSATWASRIDAGRVDVEQTAKHGVAPESVAFRGDEDAPHNGRTSADPAFWDRGPAPDPAAATAKYDALPANQWIHFVPPKGVDVRGWGTSAYDAERQQMLYWGGGHSEYKGTDVSHFSMRTGLWSGSCRPEWVLESSSEFLLQGLVSFHDRPHIPIHAYQTYAIDPPSGLMLAVKDATGSRTCVTFIYDPSAREWQPIMLQSPFGGAVMHVIVRSTPSGAIAWAEEGLFRFDAKAQAWHPLSIRGEKLPGPPWCDGSAMIYDSNRDCLWLSAAKDLSRYDLKNGQLEAIKLPLPTLLGDFPFWREAIFLPTDDLILLAKLFKDAQGRYRNVAYDVAANHWMWIELPFISDADGKPLTFTENPFSWNSAIFYDAGRNLVVLHQPVNLWLLRFNRSKAKIIDLQSR